jgi:predicted RNase H-like HicB family nuclease
MNYRVEVERETNGEWLAEVVDLPGCMAYGSTPEQAMLAAKALALHVIADRIEHGEMTAADVVFVESSVAA